jgi:hypothetical protein
MGSGSLWAAFVAEGMAKLGNGVWRESVLGDEEGALGSLVTVRATSVAGTTFVAGAAVMPSELGR